MLNVDREWNIHEERSEVKNEKREEKSRWCLPCLRSSRLANQIKAGRKAVIKKVVPHHIFTVFHNYKIK